MATLSSSAIAGADGVFSGVCGCWWDSGEGCVGRVSESESGCAERGSIVKVDGSKARFVAPPCNAPHSLLHRAPRHAHGTSRFFPGHAWQFCIEPHAKGAHTISMYEV